ncbi:hypothetical protein VBD025_00420 [Virgibacillus flavescens]|uniref:hypothetical protein n=1 Tax=Virgibacillus flavescens TaxID=1611422 RepID=UPI003D351B81
MNSYVKNYWSLYLDFLHDFEELTYSGFSLSYLCHFPSLIRSNKELWNNLSDKNFTHQLKNQVNDQKEIQVAFNTFIQEHTNKSLIKNKHGKVVLNVDTILRFPSKTLNNYFKPSKTMILMAGSKNKQKNVNKSTSSERIKKTRIITTSNTIKVKKKTPVINETANQIPVNYLSNYATDTGNAVKQVQNRARAIFNAYSKHHLYNDQKFQTAFLTKLSEIINRIDQSNRFLNDVPVSCIVLSSTHSFICRILALTAAERGIPTICMQHGIIASEFGYIPKIATIDAVYGNFEVDWYKKIGVPEDALEIIGHPRFDQAFKRSKISRAEFDKNLGLDPAKKTLMIAVRGDRGIGRWRMLIDTISEKLDVNIVIKDFPSNNPHLLTEEYPFVHSTGEYGLYDIIRNVDLVVSYPSTVGLEAMLAEKNVFILHKEFPSYTGYYNELGEMVQTDPRKLAELISSYFNDSAWNSSAKAMRNKFIHFAYPYSGVSCERLNKLINRLTS